MTMHAEDGALVRYLDGEGDERERSALALHLRTCPACDARWTTLQRQSASVSAALRASDAPLRFPGPHRFQRRLWVAAAALIVVGAAGAVTPVRAWIIGRTQALWTAVAGAMHQSAPASADTGEQPLSVTFVPSGSEFSVEVASWQAAGRLAVDIVPGDSASTVVLSGSGVEALTVLPATIRIVNSATSTASYAIHLPRRLARVRVRVGGEPSTTVDLRDGPWEVDLRTQRSRQNPRP